MESKNKMKGAIKTVRVNVPLPRVSSNSTLTLLQNQSNFTRSDAPSRVMYFDADGSWIDFGGDVVERLRSGFVEGKPMVEASVNDSSYLFDFLNMLQIDLVSSKERSIAWIDVNGSCFFPKTFVGDDFTDSSGIKESEEMDNLEIEVDVRINEGSNSGKRKREVVELEEEGEEKSWESCSNNQDDSSKRRRVATADAGIPRWSNAKLMNEDERVHTVVKSLFLSGFKSVDPGVTITSVHQCKRVGPMEKARWEVFRKQVEVIKEMRGEANIKFAWYGASEEEVESIFRHGFGIPTKVSGSLTYGVGIHLSPVRLPHLSAAPFEAHSDGEKHAILCRVILGNVEKVEAGSRQSHPSGVNFDSGVDDLTNPTRYVVWYANMNTIIIPECVVKYKPSDNLSGPTGESASSEWVPNVTNSSVVKLFSKLESSLPSEKVRELKSLCNSYKAGRMTKDVFIRELRVVSGDEMLLSSIRETRG